MEMCRACLLTEDNMIPLDEYLVTNYNVLTNLNVSLSDGMPQYSCQNCAEVIKFFIEFRSKAISSETTLREVVEKIKPEDNNIQIESKPNIQDSAIKLEIKNEVEEHIITHEEVDDHYDEDIITELHIKEDVIESTDLNSKELKNVKKKQYTYKKKKKIKDEEVSFNDILEGPKLRNEKSKKKQTTKLVDIPLSCGLCKKKFEDENTMKNHLETHKTLKQCENCLETFTTWQQMYGHRMQHLPVTQRRCHICNKRYVVCANLEYHYLTAHNNDGQAVFLSCRVCFKSYDNPIKLKKHMAAVHATKNSYICDYCSKRCNTKSALRTHILIHSEVKGFICKICGFSCKLRSGLKDHTIRKHSPEKVTCEKCKRVFENKKNYDKHKCTEKLCICPICGKKISNNKGVRYNRHLRTHEPVGRFNCDRCQKTYRTKEALRVHLNRHDGNRTYKCEFCPAKFYACSSLIRHRRTHTGEKPYVCNICSRAFMCNSNLKMHMKVHGLFIIKHRNKDPENEAGVK